VVVGWRLSLAVLLLALLGVPLAWPLGRLLAEPAGWRGWEHLGRLLALTCNTALLVGATLALAVPLGSGAAVLLYRTDLPCRGALRFGVLLTLFVPLPLFVSAWQVLAADGWLTPAAAAWTPGGQGLGPAVALHALAGLPWVIVLVGLGLTWVERELEEDALTVVGPWRVLRRVTLPRTGAAVAAAALWVGLQTAAEITVTDVMQVRTFAEEVYTQLVAPEAGAGADPVARAVAVTLPGVALAALLVVFLARRWERALPPRAALLAPPLLLPLGPLRWPLGVLALAAGGVLAGVPLLALVRQAGLSGAPPTWSAGEVAHQLARALRLGGGHLVECLLWSAAAGAVCAGLALAVCWAMRGAPRFRTGVLVLLAVAWAMPGPLLGLGLKGTIDGLLAATGSPWPLARLLWYGPSYAPVLWVDLVRFFPCAVALLWPVVRLLPAELLDAARTDGAAPGRVLVRVVWPLTARAVTAAALAVAVLALGELSAGKLVSTPGAPSYAQVVFEQLHSGASADLAARSLLLLAAVAAGALILHKLSQHTTNKA
jgi:iron(III) transport system permease protein